MQDEGYIKFRFFREEKEAGIGPALLDEMNRIRRILVARKWLGMTDGIGYGNLSCRQNKEESGFFISGSATGALTELSAEHISHIYAYDFERHEVHCRGFIDPSSESLTHAAIYSVLPHVMAVIHIHDTVLWERNRSFLSGTPDGIDYGSSAMADAVRAAASNTTSPALLRMGGHAGGWLAWGKTLEEVITKGLNRWL